jgi:phosphohistidine phosphatase
MDLILWRHAEAEEGGADLARALTGKGRKQAARVAEWLQQRLPAKFALLASPAVRAQQTAEALGAKIRTVERLAPGARVGDILAAAGWPDQKGAVVVVGHQPDLGSTVAHLMSGAGGDWSLKKGALVWLASRDRDDEKQVVLRAAISPDLL